MKNWSYQLTYQRWLTRVVLPAIVVLNACILKYGRVDDLFNWKVKRMTKAKLKPKQNTQEQPRIGIIGAGMSGVLMAIKFLY